MSTRLFRSFSAELMKIATDIPDDAAIRAVLADRKGEEYLEGGEIFSNAPEPLIQKVGYSSITPSSIGYGSPLSSTTESKGSKKYQENRDWGVTGLRGALGGAGTAALVHNLHDAEKRITTRGVRTGAAIGTALAVGDRLVRRRDKNNAIKDVEKKILEKKAGIVSPLAETTPLSPARRLTAGQQTASPMSGSRMVGKAPKAVRLGNKFRLPI